MRELPPRCLQRAQRILDAAMEGRVGVDHVAQRASGHLSMNGNGERPEDLAAGRAGRGRADQHAAVGVLDEL